MPPASACGLNDPDEGYVLALGSNFWVWSNCDKLDVTNSLVYANVVVVE